MRNYLIHCNIDNNDYQHDSKVLYTFVPNKPFGQLLDILYFCKLFNSGFSYIEVWITDQVPRLQETKGKIKINLFIN